MSCSSTVRSTTRGDKRRQKHTFFFLLHMRLLQLVQFLQRDIVRGAVILTLGQGLEEVMEFLYCITRQEGEIRRSFSWMPSGAEREPE